MKNLSAPKFIKNFVTGAMIGAQTFLPFGKGRANDVPKPGPVAMQSVEDDTPRTQSMLLAQGPSVNPSSGTEAPLVQAAEKSEQAVPWRTVTTAQEINDFFASEKVKNSRLVIVKFGADWCGPCREMKKKLDEDYAIDAPVLWQGTPSEKKYSDVFEGAQFLEVKCDEAVPDLSTCNAPALKDFQTDTLPVTFILTPQGHTIDIEAAERQKNGTKVSKTMATRLDGFDADPSYSFLVYAAHCHQQQFAKEKE